MSEVKKVIKADLYTLAKQLIKTTEAMESGDKLRIAIAADYNRKLIKKLNLDG